MKLEEFAEAHVFTLNRYYFCGLQTRENGTECHERNRWVKLRTVQFYFFLMQIGISTSRIFHESPEFFQLLTDRSIS